MTDGDKHMRAHALKRSHGEVEGEERWALLESYSAGPDERRSSVLSDSFQIEPAGAVEGGKP